MNKLVKKVVLQAVISWKRKETPVFTPYKKKKSFADRVSEDDYAEVNYVYRHVGDETFISRGCTHNYSNSLLDIRTRVQFHVC